MHAIARFFTLVALLAVVVAPTWADSPACSCPIKAAMEKLPTLVFSVGDETTACDKHAAELAESKDAPLRYTVRQSYESEAAAHDALIAATEGALQTFTTASKCSKSGTTTIAGEKIQCEKSAAKLAAAVEDAVEAVQVSFKVGDESCHCPSKAEALAKESGKQLVYVVDDDETCCPTANKLNLARAKFRAALHTVSAELSEPAQAKGSKCSGCPIEAGMKSLPQLVYLIDGEATTCAKHAKKLAKESDAKMRFAVQHSFDCQQTATHALVVATEALADQFATPSTCSKSGTTTIAGKKLHCDKTAAKLAKDIRAAMDAVKVSYLVGDEKCHCPNQAAALAKSSGEKKLFVVDGEETSCELTSRLNLARAKYRAAVKAIADQASADQGEAAKSQS